MLEVNERIGGPELLVEFFAGDQVARTLQQDFKDAEGLRAQFKLDAVFMQLTDTGFKFVWTKPEVVACHLRPGKLRSNGSLPRSPLSCNPKVLF